MRNNLLAVMVSLFPYPLLYWFLIGDFLCLSVQKLFSKNVKERKWGGGLKKNVLTFV